MTIRAAHAAQRSKRVERLPLTPLRCVRGSDSNATTNCDIRSDPSMSTPHLRLHEFLPESRANGPGVRAVVWVQGCSLGCPGCFNPETHPASGGRMASVDDLLREIAGLGDAIEGVTLSGGEPLQQRGAVVALLRRLR